MTPNLDEKIDFLNELDAVCVKHLRENNNNNVMIAYITNFTDEIREELEPLEEEQDYYAEKYRPTEADL